MNNKGYASIKAKRNDPNSMTSAFDFDENLGFRECISNLDNTDYYFDELTNLNILKNVSSIEAKEKNQYIENGLSSSNKRANFNDWTRNKFSKLFNQNNKEEQSIKNKNFLNENINKVIEEEEQDYDFFTNNTNFFIKNNDSIDTDDEQSSEEEKLKTTLKSKIRKDKCCISELFSTNDLDNSKYNLDSKKEEKLATSQLQITRFNKDNISSNVEIENKNEIDKKKGLELKIKNQNEIPIKKVAFEEEIQVFQPYNKNLMSSFTNKEKTISKHTDINTDNSKHKLENLNKVSLVTVDSSNQQKKAEKKTLSYTEYFDDKADISQNINVKENDDKKTVLKIYITLTKQDCKFLQSTTGIIIDESIKIRPKLLLSTYLTAIYKSGIENENYLHETKQLKNEITNLIKAKEDNKIQMDTVVLEFNKKIDKLQLEIYEKKTEIETLNKKIYKLNNFVENEIQQASEKNLKILQKQVDGIAQMKDFYNAYVDAYIQLVTSIATHNFKKDNENKKCGAAYFKNFKDIKAKLKYLNQKHYDINFFQEKVNVEKKQSENHVKFADINQILSNFIDWAFEV
ncbi:hypothetical protein QEN19_004034 [Hanseniaspora menglaensis]